MVNNTGIRIIMGHKATLGKLKKSEIIYEVIKSASGPLSVFDILQAVNKQKQTISIATVYRSIKTFLKDEKIRVVYLSDGNTRYEITSTDHVHYFLCRVCKMAFKIDHCCLNLQEDEVEGHLVRGHEISVSGICKECR